MDSLRYDPDYCEDMEREAKAREATRTCAVCGKSITSGYVWDGTDTFCSDACAASPFENPYAGEQGDSATLEMLIDEGRMVWRNEFHSNEL